MPESTGRASTSSEEADAGVGRRTIESDYRRIVDVAIMATGLVLVFVVALLWCLQSHGQVDPRRLVRLPVTPMDAAWFAALGSMAGGVMAAAGLPSARHTRAAVRSAFGQGAAALAVGAGTGMGTSLGNLWIYGPEDRCVYADCWPADLQAFAAAVPGLLTAAMLLAMAARVGSLSWRTRALVPAAAWLGSAIAVRVLWEPMLIPILQAPPP